MQSIDEQKAVAAFNALRALAKQPAPKTGGKVIAFPRYILSPSGVSQDTVEEVTWWVRHELDLYEEGQESDLTPRTAAAARRFLTKHGK